MAVLFCSQAGFWAKKGYLLRPLLSGNLFSIFHREEDAHRTKMQKIFIKWVDF